MFFKDPSNLGIDSFGWCQDAKNADENEKQSNADVGLYLLLAITKQTMTHSQGKV